ncbi:MAG: hypothetical protein HON32_07415 [Francisellaceae bacterium]|jgi:cell division transport system permease protein|nr:hypothetical protein [Francisellaceae bacterium]MBT6538401.1 hypothetical protein [Francisellaceae bacterium]
MHDIKNYFYSHYQNFISSLNHLSQHPIKSILSILIISFTFILPSSLWVLTNNVTKLVNLKDPSAKLSVFFIDSSITAEHFISTYANHAAVTKYEYHSSSQNLELLRQHLDSLDLTDLNKIAQLPASITYYLNENTSPDVAHQLQQTIKLDKHSEHTQLDLEWLTRWQGVIMLCKKIAIILASILSIGAALIIGGLTKNAIEHQQESIKVMDLVGASRAFVRRQFIYLGFWRGIFSGIITVLIIQLIVLTLSNNFDMIFKGVQANAALEGLDLQVSAYLILLCMTIGILGSWLAFNQYHNKLIRPK